MQPLKKEFSMGLSKEELKEAVKKAHKEWLDEQFAAVGKWALRSLLGFALVLFIRAVLNSQGWHKP